MKETDEESAIEPSALLETKTTKMNGTKNGSSSNSNDVKYPANCAMRLGSTPGYADDGDNDMYEPKQNKKIWRILTVLVYVFTVSFGAILLSLYYLFLWDPYKNAGHAPTPSAQANAPAPSAPSIQDKLILSTPSSVPYEGPSTLSDSMVDNLVKDLNNGVEPRTLALAIKALAAKDSEQHLEVPLHVYEQAQHSSSAEKKLN